MKKRKSIVCLICGFFLIAVSANAQTDKKYLRKGNREYEKKNYPESEILYRKASDKNKQSPDAAFNIGDALYRQNKYDDAGKQFLDNTNETENPEKKSAGWYNMGNSLLKANKIKESIEAYKNSLKLNPDNPDAKYNLGYAQDLLKQQQEQQQKQQQQQQNKDNKDQNKDQNKEDQKDKNENNKDQQKKEQQQQQPQEQSISKEDAQRLLNALANDEKNVQEKVNREKAAQARVRTAKNW